MGLHRRAGDEHQGWKSRGWVACGAGRNIAGFLGVWLGQLRDDHTVFEMWQSSRRA